MPVLASSFLPSRPELPLGHRCPSQPPASSRLGHRCPSRPPASSRLDPELPLGHRCPVPTSWPSRLCFPVSRVPLFGTGELALAVSASNPRSTTFQAERPSARLRIRSVLAFSILFSPRPRTTSSVARLYSLPGHERLCLRLGFASLTTIFVHPSSFLFGPLRSPWHQPDSPPSASGSITTYPTSWVRVLTRICLLSFSISRRPLALLLHHQAATVPLSFPLSLSRPGRVSTKAPPFLSPSLSPSLSFPLCLKPRSSVHQSHEHHLSSLQLPSLPFFLSLSLCCTRRQVVGVVAERDQSRRLRPLLLPTPSFLRPLLLPTPISSLGSVPSPRMKPISFFPAASKLSESGLLPALGSPSSASSRPSTEAPLHCLRPNCHVICLGLTLGHLPTFGFVPVIFVLALALDGSLRLCTSAVPLLQPL